jgi:hypothetical protein
MKFYESTLEWDGENLYRIQGSRREFLGTVRRYDPESGRTGWMVWMRAENVATFATLDEAKAFLERIV